MQEPIILNYTGDVYIFSTVQGAEQYAEPLSAEHGEFTAYDATGRELSISWTTNTVSIFSTGQESVRVSELEYVLRKYLVAVGDVDADDVSCDVQCLIERCRYYSS